MVERFLGLIFLFLTKKVFMGWPYSHIWRRTPRGGWHNHLKVAYTSWGEPPAKLCNIIWRPKICALINRYYCFTYQLLASCQEMLHQIAAMHILLFCYMLHIWCNIGLSEYSQHFASHKFLIFLLFPKIEGCINFIDEEVHQLCLNLSYGIWA